jgi:hypothetical protein
MPVSEAKPNATPAAGSTQVTTYGWSGVATTNRLKKWKGGLSCYGVYSVSEGRCRADVLRG